MTVENYNQTLSGKLVIGEQVKPKLRELIDQLCSLCRKAREDGLLVLEDSLPGLTEPMLKLGVRLVLDGTEADTVRGILLTAIHAGNYEGGELVKRMIIADGVMLLQQGENPANVKTYLSAWLGEDEAAAALDS